MHKHTANYRGVKLYEATRHNSGNHLLFTKSVAIAHDYGSTLLKIPPYYIYTQHEVPFPSEATTKRVE